MRQSDPFIRTTWGLAVVSVAIYCLMSFFYWSLIDVVTPFAAPILWLPVLMTALVAVVVAILLPFRRWRTLGIASVLPLGFLFACFLIIRFVDFTALWLTANFKFHHADRLEVVRRIESGEFRPNVSHNPSLIALPRDLAHVSLGGGEVEAERDGDRYKILFFTFRGVLDSFAGFVYTSEGSAPKDGDFAGKFVIVRKIEDRWHYISAH